MLATSARSHATEAAMRLYRFLPWTAAYRQRAIDRVSEQHQRDGEAAVRLLLHQAATLPTTGPRVHVSTSRDIGDGRP